MQLINLCYLHYLLVEWTDVGQSINYKLVNRGRSTLGRSSMSRLTVGRSCMGWSMLSQSTIVGRLLIN